MTIIIIVFFGGDGVEKLRCIQNDTLQSRLAQLHIRLVIMIMIMIMESKDMEFNFPILNIRWSSVSWKTGVASSNSG